MTAAITRRKLYGGITCNLIAGLAHDYLFVGWDQGPQALALLGAYEPRAVHTVT